MVPLAALVLLTTRRTFAADCASAHLLPIDEVTTKMAEISRSVCADRRAHRWQTNMNRRFTGSVDAIDVRTLFISAGLGMCKAIIA